MVSWSEEGSEDSPDCPDTAASREEDPEEDPEAETSALTRKAARERRQEWGR